MATKKAMKVNSGQAGKAPFIQARIDRLIDYGDSHVKAYASANIGGAFAIHGIKVIESAKGLFVAMPQTHHILKRCRHRDWIHERSWLSAARSGVLPLLLSQVRLLPQASLASSAAH